jgi:hypothetical protein
MSTFLAALAKVARHGAADQSEKSGRVRGVDKSNAGGRDGLQRQCGDDYRQSAKIKETLDRFEAGCCCHRPPSSAHRRESSLARGVRRMPGFSLAPSDDGRLRPDMIIRLPGGKNIVVALAVRRSPHRPRTCGVRSALFRLVVAFTCTRYMSWTILPSARILPLRANMSLIGIVLSRFITAAASSVFSACTAFR